MKRFDLLLLGLIASFVCLGTFGCGKTNPELKTIQGLQEENKVLREQIDGLRVQIESHESKKVESKTDFDLRIQALENEHKANLTKQSELNQKQASLFQSESATLRLELVTVQRERLALRELVDREPIIQEAKVLRSSTDSIVVFLLLGISILVSVILVIRYRSVSDRLNLLTMQQVSELRRLGGGV